jgi:hypothetical protein
MVYTVLNPHLSDFFAKPISFIYLKRRALKKYQYIIEPSNENGVTVNFLFNNLSSSLFPDKYFNLLPYLLKKIILKIEIKKWRKINDIHPDIKCYFDVNDIPERNTVFMLCYRNYKHGKNIAKIAGAFKQVIAHLTHYYAFPAEYSSLLKPLQNVHIAADSDVAGNDFFKTHFGWYTKPVLFIPFAISERFSNKKVFEQREKKAIATGTFHVLENDVTENDPNCFAIKKISNTIHPIRRKLYENKDSVADFVDVYCKPFYEKNNADINSKSATVSNKMQASQAAYFSFDIVDKYNQYKFAVIGEETINGLPGIGSFEAMACGCVLIADPSCYVGLSMQANVHYLAYESTIESLIKTIKENTDTEKLKRIGNTASDLIQSTMQPGPLKKYFLQVLKKL